MEVEQNQEYHHHHRPMYEAGMEQDYIIIIDAALMRASKQKNLTQH